MTITYSRTPTLDNITAQDLVDLVVALSNAKSNEQKPTHSLKIGKAYEFHFSGASPKYSVLRGTLLGVTNFDIRIRTETHTSDISINRSFLASWEEIT